MVAYLNCELAARDLDARILIAAYLLNAGTPVVVGQVWSILHNMAKSPRGVMLFGTANVHQAKWMAKARSAGHAVLAMDEEILATRDEAVLAQSVHADAVAGCDLFLFQDARHRQALSRAYPNIKGEVTGNPRIELLQRHRHLYAAGAEAHRAGGKYVLFNTNFTMLNSVWGGVAEARAAAASAMTADRGAAVSELYLQNDIANRAFMMALIAWLKHELPEYRIVVRPHPAENPEAWQEVDGVEIVVGSNGLPWMLGASLVVHATSTTGLEGILMSVPCLNIGRRRADLVLDEVNFSTLDMDTAADAMRALLRDDSGPLAAFRPPADAYIGNGAQAVAGAILKADTMHDVSSITRWGTKPRSDMQKTKMTISQADFVARLNALCTPLVGAKIKVSPLDDSVFLLTV